MRKRRDKNVEICPVVIPKSERLLGLDKTKFVGLIVFLIAITFAALAIGFAFSQYRQSKQIDRNSDALTYVCQNQKIIKDLAESAIAVVQDGGVTAKERVFIDRFNQDIGRIEQNSACSGYSGHRDRKSVV